ncbi:hypothetical protein P167DRAFT_536894, partial [Morchella conica CCBAS932]
MNQRIVRLTYEDSSSECYFRDFFGGSPVRSRRAPTMGQGNPESRLSMRTKKRPVVDDDNDDPRSWV